MAVQDETKNDDLLGGVAAKAVADYGYYQAARDLIVVAAISACILTITLACLLLGWGGWDAVEGFLACFVVLAVGLWPDLLAKFKPSRPMRIGREAIWLLAILCAAIALRCWSACLFGGGGTVFHFKGLYVLRVVLLGLVPFMALRYCLWLRPGLEKRGVLKFLSKVLNARLRLKIGCEKKLGCEKELKRMQNWLGRKVDAFVRNHPSLILSSEKEYVILSGRYTTWGMMSSVLVLEAYMFARRFFA